MTQYKIFFSNPATQYIHVEIIFENISHDVTTIKLSKWRPGRYEFGNFSKNVKGFSAIDCFNLQQLDFKKKDNDTWEINTIGTKAIKIAYQYYANELNAGSSFLNAQQLYVNPINNCMFIESKINEACTLEIAVPSQYKIAIGLEKIENQKYMAENFHELADSPFIASPLLNTFSVDFKGYEFYFDFMGECIVDEDKILRDFIPFIERQLDFFGEMPSKMYRFLFQILPIKFYHGVEHKTSTVIALGPGYNLYNGKTYHDLLGVSCHELFHVWNIKSIRPTEMLPYDYTKENFARTGFVYEGITTYYGDLLLFQSKVYSQEDYFVTLEERITKHFHNDGRFNLSVADASFETWLDGYVPGTPGRKTSIYDEGNLVAFILDVFILENSKNENSLETLMHHLYHQFYKNGLAYDYDTIVQLVNTFSNADSSSIFSAIVTGKDNYIPFLNHAFYYLGLDLIVKPSDHHFEKYFGFKLVETITEAKVSSVADNSPASFFGMMVGDSVIAINNYSIQADASHWLNYFIAKGVDIEITLRNAGRIRTLKLPNNNSDFNIMYFNKYEIVHKEEKFSQNFMIWAKI
jgi:predicted metalloprotease with PDZ domain